ncbi:MAG TPA: ABC transporter ATP-binding protein [Acidobacteriota bacterium]|mgnify:CR=1 FL=1|nr:ABC transporter ATP-binding protein [Acidobacteriota bacterium]HNT16289.1 ABC transporter ATP-binding protein [Acidobacteriota bacterium]HPA26453.1 ABC transporter ATP-binding protein [Acidobacteriota bacterium]HQO18829.1 ABC transporter ATP-binding protein [Acidobacteriota bacterium]HQQ47214.1 ABC transporter ATP-binding protein [Acidobacteriota bacterium]
MTLEARGVSFAYGSGESLVKGFSALFPPGSVTAILGPNGAGKTTFLKLLLGLLKPCEGEIICKGKSISETSHKERAETISYLPQRSVQPQEWSLWELAEKGGFPRRGGGSFGEFIQKKKREAGELLELEDLWERPISTLSGGELQRGLIARCLVQDCPILVMDEPMNHLDLAHRLRICGLFDRLSTEGKTVIYAVHDFNISIQFNHRLFVLKKGGEFVEAPKERGAMESLLKETYFVDFSSIDIHDFSYYYPKKNGSN